MNNSTMTIKTTNTYAENKAIVEIIAEKMGLDTGFAGIYSGDSISADCIYLALSGLTCITTNNIPLLKRLLSKYAYSLKKETRATNTDLETWFTIEKK